MSKKIMVRLSKNGQEVKIEGLGFEGSECISKSQPFFQALGSIERQELKPEYESYAGAMLVELEKETF